MPIIFVWNCEIVEAILRHKRIKQSPSILQSVEVSSPEVSILSRNMYNVLSALLVTKALHFYGLYYLYSSN